MRFGLPVIAVLLAFAGPLHAQAALFEFQSAFWLNLHHYLHALTRPGGPLNEPLPAAATVTERDTWTAAVGTYRERYGKRSLLFDAELVRVKLALVAAASKDTLDAAGLPEPMRTALLSAAPMYRRHVWLAHDAANRRAMAEATRLVQRHGRAIATRLATSYGESWPATPLRADFVYDAGPPGNAYTTNDPTHITIAASDPRHANLHLLELLFHEASHGWDATLMREIDAAARQRNVRAPRDLWHGLLFFNAGRLTSEALQAAGVRDYQMYADKEKLFAGRWERWRPSIATHWPAFLAGTITRQEAIARIVKEVATP